MLFEIIYSCWFGLAIVGFAFPLLSGPPRLVMRAARTHTAEAQFVDQDEDQDEDAAPRTIPSLI